MDSSRTLGPRNSRCSRRSVLRGVGGAGLLACIGAPRLASASPRASAYPATVATQWFSLVLGLIKGTPGFSPPVASRALGYLGLGLYEALVPGMPGFQSLAGALPAFGPAPGPHNSGFHWPSVANVTLAALCRALFPTTSAANKAAIDALEQSFAAQFAAEIGPGKAKQAEKRGQAIAAHVFQYSSGDGGHEAYLNNFPAYTPPVGPGLWRPTAPAFQPALQPYWGAKRAFAMPTNDAFDPGPPTPYSATVGSPAYLEALQVRDTGNSLTPDQQAIALFWADNAGATATPPGHSISILTQVLSAQGAALDLAAEAYAKVGMAVADAFVACWNTKYRYNLLRPITYIRDHIGPGWSPLLATPPFPEYTSGHSVQSGATAQVLTDLFGALAFTDHTHDAIGLPARSFADFFEAAEEAAISRLYGGIHFLPAIELGVTQGIDVGQAVLDLPFYA